MSGQPVGIAGKWSASLLLLALALVAVVAIGCGDDDAAQDGAAGEGTAGTLKVAVNVPTSGPGAAFGLPQAYAFEILADEFNAEGGIEVGGKRYEVEIIVDDNKWDPSATRSAVEKEINRDEVKFIATVGDPVDPVIVPVAERSKVIVIDWTGNKQFLQEPYKYVIGTFVSPNVMGKAYYEALLKHEPDIKTMWEIAFDLQFDRNNVEWEKAAATPLGLEHLGATFYPDSTVDFTTAVAPAVRAKPDLMALGSEGANMAAITTAIKQLGFDGVISSAVTATSLEETVKGAGDAAEGFYQAELFGYPTTPALDEFKEKYREKSGGEWSTLAANMWIGAKFLFEAIQNAGTIDDTDKIVEAMESTTIKAPFLPGEPDVSLGGEDVYGQRRELSIPVAINRYENGEFKTLEVINAGTP